MSATESGSARGIERKEEEKEEKELPLFPEEIRQAKHDILDFVLHELLKVENYWKFRYRYIVSKGIGISCKTFSDIAEIEDGLVIDWRLKVFIPEEVWVQLARLRKRRMYKLPKPHPVIRQRYRDMEEVGRSVEEEIERIMDEIEEESVEE